MIAPAPLVTGAISLVDDQRRHALPFQAGCQRDTALAATDDQHIGLGGIAEFCAALLAFVGPVFGVQLWSVLGAEGAAPARGFGEIFEFASGCQHSPRQAVA